MKVTARDVNSLSKINCVNLIWNKIHYKIIYQIVTILKLCIHNENTNTNVLILKINENELV